MSRHKKVWLFLVLVVIAAVITILAVFVSAYNKKQNTGKEEDAYSAKTAENAVAEEGYITYKGKKYKYNDHLTNVLLLGIDSDGVNDTEVGSTEAGQADAIYLLSYDRVTGNCTVLSIPRDTMTKIETFLPDGTSGGKAIDHVSLSYGFGDGKHESCKLTKNAVSNLLYGLPITYYAAINLDSLPIISEALGNVEVTVPDDSLEDRYPEYKEGEVVTIDPSNTELFVRSRDTDVLNSALSRQNRQMSYIKACKEKAFSLQADDEGFLSHLFVNLKDHMITNMTAGDFVDVMSAAIKGRNQEMMTIPGTGQAGEYYDEYIVDDDALYDMILQVFYKEVDAS